MQDLSGGDCPRARKELGVYVLGAIGPGERAQVDRHLAVCPWCRDELAGLAGLPGLLRRLSPGEAARTWANDTTGRLPGPPVDRLLRRAATIRLRRRLTAAAAALVVGLGAAAGVQLLHSRCQLAVINAQGQDTAAGGWSIAAGSLHAW